MRRAINFILSKLPVFKQLNGMKTELGFGLYLLAWIAEGLTNASGFFPDVGIITDAAVAVESFHVQAINLIESLGITLAGVGLYHDKVKREQSN